MKTNKKNQLNKNTQIPQTEELKKNQKNKTVLININRNIGEIIKPLQFLLSICFVLSCLQLFSACALNSTNAEPRNQYKTNDPDRPLVDDKYSLADDRKVLQDLRTQVPEQKQRENDELALILKLTETVDRPPSDIRNKFDQMVRKRRETFDRDIQKERDQFTKVERRERDLFLKEQQKKRDDYNKEKHTREEKNEFYKEADEKRSQFFADSREKRDDFEADIRERRKNFEDYIREKNNSFNQEMRSYSERYNAKEREKLNNQQ